MAVCTPGELRPTAGAQDDGVSRFTYPVVVVMTKSEATFKVTSLRKCAQHQLRLGILFVYKKRQEITSLSLQPTGGFCVTELTVVNAFVALQEGTGLIEMDTRLHVLRCLCGFLPEPKHILA